MALLRDKFLLEPPKPPRKKHKVTPIVGEFGRYLVPSQSAAKRGRDEAYIVDIFEKEETNAGVITGTCGCKGWSVRKACSHLEDAREEHARIVAEEKATDLGFDNLNSPDGKGLAAAQPAQGATSEHSHVNDPAVSQPEE